MHPQTMPINQGPGPALDLVEDTEALQHLHDRIADALEGFRVMADQAEPSFRPVVERFVALHEAHGTTVANMLVARRATDRLNGTLMGTVNKAVVSLRALFTSIDAGVMDSIRSSEEHVLEAFDRAIGGVADAADATELSVMQDELVMLLDDTRDLR